MDFLCVGGQTLVFVGRLREIDAKVIFFLRAFFSESQAIVQKLMKLTEKAVESRR